MTAKVKSKSKLKKEVWKIFSEYIRLRDCLKTTGTPDWGKCVTCGKEVSIKACDAGHAVPGRGNAILFDETCTHLQCKRCNGPLGGNLLEYRRAIIRMYGEGYDEYLEQKARKPSDFQVWELETMKDVYREKIKKLKEGK